MNWSNPAHVANYLAKPRDLDQPVLNVSGEALLLFFGSRFDYLSFVLARTLLPLPVNSV